MSESHVQLAERISDLFAKGDIPAVLALFDERIEWREAEGHPYRPSGAPLVGPQAILTDLFMRLGQEWDGLSVTPASLLPRRRVCSRRGGPKALCKATGRSLDAQFAHVLTMRDGRLVGFQQYIDTAQLQAVMERSAG